MPPIFGIVNFDQKCPDLEMIKQINGAASFFKPRHIIDVTSAGSWLAAVYSKLNDQTQKKNWYAKSENLVIVADAILYKREDLIANLGAPFLGESLTNAELILKSYVKWGPDCINYLYGDFAFIILDFKKHEIFCGRDKLGIKPLFYSYIDGGFVFGSELRFITSAFIHEPEIDEVYFLETLVTIIDAKHRSPYKEVFRLAPGSYLLYKNDRQYLTSYWKLDPKKRVYHKDEKSYIELFRQKLVEAVALRCKDVIKIGNELSGGLDSSSILGIAANCATQYSFTLAAFSNVFPDNSDIEFRDEKEFIKKQVAFSNIEWVGVNKFNSNIIDLLRQATKVQGSYIKQNYSIFNYGIYEAARKKDVDVLLSGFGGDEMVSASIAVPWNELMNNGEWRALFEELFYKGWKVKKIMKLFLILVKYIISRIYQPTNKTGGFTKELLDRRFARLPLQPDFAKEKNLRQMLTDKHKFSVRRTIAERQVDRIMANHLPQRLEYCYAAAAQFGIEYRYPLLDVDLIETYLAFPPWLKHHHGVNRYVFREAIKGFIPEEIRNRNDKSGSTIPHIYHSLVKERDSIFALIDEASLNPELNKIFDFSKFKPWYEALVARDEREMNTLMPGAFYQYLMMLLYYK